MRKLIFSTMALMLALSLFAFAPNATHAQDDGFVVCSTPANEATVDVLPATVSVTFAEDVVADGTILYVSDEDSGARVDVDGSSPTVEGATVTVELNTAVSDDVAVAVTAGSTYEILGLIKTSEDGRPTRVVLTFTVSEDASEAGDAEGDCETDEDMGDMGDMGDEACEDDSADDACEIPAADGGDETAADGGDEAVVEDGGDEAGDETAADGGDEAAGDGQEDATEVPTEEATEEPTEEATEEPTEEATEEPTEEATEEPTEEATEEPTEEATEEATEEPTEEPSMLGEAADYAVGGVNLSIAAPADYATRTDEDLYVLPITLFASSDETIDAYVAQADDVDEFVVIFTSFTTADLGTFGLTEDADNAAIIDALIRNDSDLGDAEETEVAGAAAVAHTFDNPTSGKSGKFHLVNIDGNYLLIQGSAPTDSWAEYAPLYDEVIASIAVAEAAE